MFDFLTKILIVAIGYFGLTSSLMQQNDGNVNSIINQSEVNMSQCCSYGVDRAKQSMTQSCASMSVPTAQIFQTASLDSVMYELCSRTAHMCCSSQQVRSKCELGQTAALANEQCYRTAYGEPYEECCRQCQLGLLFASTIKSCDYLNEIQQDSCSSDSFNDCCQHQLNLENDSEQQPKNDRQKLIKPNLFKKYNRASQLTRSFSSTTYTTYNQDKISNQDDADRTCNGQCQHICKQQVDSVSNSAILVCHCNPGYILAEDLRTCLDDDECSSPSKNACIQQSQTCHNTIGSYVCRNVTEMHVARKVNNQCASGLRYHVANHACIDVDECAEGINDCNPSTETCLNYNGGYECKRRVAVLQSHQTRNNLNSQLQCPLGYSFNEQSGNCQDLNECQHNSHACLPSQRCDNTIGSYTCIRLTGCGTGYTLNAHTSNCEDDDECALGTHNCASSYECKNTHGSFRCARVMCPPGSRLENDTDQCVPIQCPSGYELDKNQYNCIDIDECLVNPGICGPNHRCINAIGSYNCQGFRICPAGFQLALNQSCIDIDECATGANECASRNQICLNRPGGYNCQCHKGYQINPQTKHCEDIDECSRNYNMCGNSADCINTPGSHMCRCKSGFRQSDLSSPCTDIDECLEHGANLCEHKCINTWGGFQCICDHGFNLNADNRSCTDIDECEMFKDRGALCIGKCVNIRGSYQCSCPNGYRLQPDKRSCQDIDECAEHPHTCAPQDTCLNIRGGHRCNRLICPPGYSVDTEQKNRCKRDNVSCNYNDKNCVEQPLSYSYNYLTFVSNLRISPTGQMDLFTMRGPSWASTTVQFDLILKKALAPHGVTPATRENFRLRRTAASQAVVSLVDKLQGPQEVELELSTKIYHQGLFGGEAVAYINIYVSEHEF